jgi:hypothetical protein
LTHSLKPPGFNPFNLSSENLVQQAFAFKCTMYLYSERLHLPRDLFIVANDAVRTTVDEWCGGDPVPVECS